MRGICGYGHESGRKATKEKETRKGKKSPSLRRPARGRARGEANSAHAISHEEHEATGTAAGARCGDRGTKGREEIGIDAGRRAGQAAYKSAPDGC